MNDRKVRRIYLAFEFERDAQRRLQFMSQAQRLCNFLIDDRSLPSAVHDTRWQKEALGRIRSSHVLFVLLGPDTHNASGVRDEISLAGQARVPVFQLMPSKRNYGLVSARIPLCPYRWAHINRVLQNPGAHGQG